LDLTVLSFDSRSFSWGCRYGGAYNGGRANWSALGDADRVTEVRRDKTAADDPNRGTQPVDRTPWIAPVLGS